MYWFSPAPCPVEWYEYVSLVMLTCSFSAMINAFVQPIMSIAVKSIKHLVYHEEDTNIEEALVSTIENMTGIRPELDWTLDQCGLSSIGLPQLASRLNRSLSTKTNPVTIGTSMLISARTVSDIVHLVETAVSNAHTGGI